MGRARAVGMAEAVAEGAVSLQAALEWHLTANHYPPLSPGLTGTAERALELVREGHEDELVELPPQYRAGRVSAGQIVEAFHLEDFIDLS